MTNDNDKLLSLDFNFAVCLLAADDLIEALSELYTATWLLTSGDEPEANALYRGTYRSILRRIADESYPLTVTDEFKEQYEAQDYGEQD